MPRITHQDSPRQNSQSSYHSNGTPPDAATRFAVLAIQKMRRGEPISPRSRTRQHFGPYLVLIDQMAHTLAEAMAAQESDAAIIEVMEVYWTVVRRDPMTYSELVAAVDAEDLVAAGRNGQPTGEAKADYTPILTLMSDVTPKDIEWLWWPYIAIGKICMWDGDPGLGKSLCVLQIAASLSRGHPLPDQQGQPTLATGGPQKTLILCNEDGLEDTIRPRLDRARADTSQIIHMAGWKDKDDQAHYFTLQHLPALEAALKQHYPRLVIIDPIQSYLGKVDMSRSNETRPLLDALTALAEKYRCAIVCIRHPSKPGQQIGKVIHRGLGGVDFIGAARTGLFAEQHPADPNKVLLGQSKSNIGPLGRTQVYTKEKGEFRWCGVSRLTAEMLGGNSRGPEPYAFLEAVCWLEERFKSEIPEKSETIEQEAAAQGISHKILVKAKKALGIRSLQTVSGWLCILPALPSIPSSTLTRTGSTGYSGSTGDTGDTGYSDGKTSTYETADPEAPKSPVDPVDPEYPVDPIVTGGSVTTQPTQNHLQHARTHNAVSPLTSNREAVQEAQAVPGNHGTGRHRRRGKDPGAWTYPPPKRSAT